MKCGADPRIAERYCFSCGAKLKNKNAAVCLKCGSPLKSSGLGGLGGAGGKDPNMVALVSVLGLFILGAPGIGYFMVGKPKKGIAYIVVSWLVMIVAAVIVGFTCCVPVILLAVGLDLAIVWDAYLEAKGEKPILPDILSE